MKLTNEEQQIFDRVNPIIEVAGFKYGEAAHIVEEFDDYSCLHYIKKFGNPMIPALHFNWRIDDDGGPVYFVGKLSISGKLNKEESFRSALFTFEVWDIMEHELNQLDKYIDFICGAYYASQAKTDPNKKPGKREHKIAKRNAL